MAKKVNIVESVNDLPDGVSFPDGVAIDTETLGLQIPRDRLCVAQLSDGKGNVWLVKFDGTDYSAPNLKALLEDESVLKIFHFGRFDIAVLEHYLGSTSSPVYCTKIASKLTRTYTDRHGLKVLCEELIGVKLDKEQQSSYWAASQLSDAQKHYAASDVLYLHELKKVFDERLEDVGRTHLAARCFAFLPHRCALDLAGWGDVDIFSH